MLFCRWWIFLFFIFYGFALGRLEVTGSEMYKFAMKVHGERLLSNVYVERTRNWGKE